MKVAIAGASGLIGTRLTSKLRHSGHEVVHLVRRKAIGNEIHWDPLLDILNTEALEGSDAIINLCGVGIGAKRWTARYKNEILESRTTPTRLLAKTIAVMQRKPAVFISASAIGIYGSRGDETLTEVSTSGNDFLSSVCTKWEDATRPASDCEVRTVLLRSGIVLSVRGGALKKQLPLFKLGLGGKFGSGNQWQSWISIDDEVGAIEHLLTASVFGAVNLTAPNPVTNAQFTNALAATLKRPALLPIPQIAPKLILGSELATALLFSSQRVVPAALNASGYRFLHPTVEIALQELVGNNR